MKRVSVSNIFGQSFSADLEDPTTWISTCIERGSWGLPERWVDEYGTRQQDIDSSLETKDDSFRTTAVLDQNGNPVIDSNTGLVQVRPVKLYKLPAQFTVTVTDVTSEYKKKENDAWVAARSLQCDNDINALLAPAQDTTHLMMAVYNMYIALNLSGSQTPEEISGAKSQLTDALNLMGQVQALRDQRDQDISDYLASHPVG